VKARGRWRFLWDEAGRGAFCFWEWIGLVGIGEVGVMRKGVRKDFT